MIHDHEMTMWYCMNCNAPLGVAKKSEAPKCQKPECQAIFNGEDGWLNGGGGHKFDADKPRMDLLDAEAIVELSKVLTFGAKKYAAHNWRKGIAISRLLAALSRHVFAMLGGEDKDPETGLDHAAHAMCCCMFVIWTLRHKPELDDRWKA